MSTKNNNNAADGTMAGAVVVLFYRYFLPSDDGRNNVDRGDDKPILSADTLTFFQKHKAHYLPLLLRFQSELCRRKDHDAERGGGPKGMMKGRILLSEEGINGTLSCSSKLQLDEYIRAMEEFDLIGDLGLPPPPPPTTTIANLPPGQEMEIHHDAPKKGEGRFFAGIDWKISFLSGKEENEVVVNRENELFPDLKIQMVKEIINTGGLVPVQNVPDQSGKEIPPEEFHDILKEALENDGMVEEEEEEENDDDEDDVTSECENGPPSKKAKHHDIKANGIDMSATKRFKKVKKEVVLIDVRNTFEHAIGHFVHPHSRIITADGANDANCAKTECPKDGAIDDDTVDATLGEETAQPTRHPNSGTVEPTPALNPNTVTFSHFDSTFCSRFSSTLRDKKVLMYCTGGIRCVKASAMLKSRGVKDVSHLKGGIHRYLERYGSGGFYKGKMFVFDRRRALDPEDLICGDGGGEKRSESDGHVVDGGDGIASGIDEKGDGIDINEKEDGTDANAALSNDTKEKNDNNNNTDNNKSALVGKCIECQTPYDELSGAILCTVCRDLILLCDSCRSNDGNLWEYHCKRHQSWKNAYFTFLDRFSLQELQSQHDKLQCLHDSYTPKENRNVRRTLRKQMDKVLARMDDLTSGVGTVEKNPKRRCRTCFESEDICDGLCWGFWKHSQSMSSSSPALVSEGERLERIAKVEVGDRVRPGPNWNEMRLGSRYYTVLKHNRGRDLGGTPQNGSSDGDSYNGAKVRVGTVMEVKSWAGGDELDCVAVVWDKDANDCSSSIGSRLAKRGRGKKKKKDESGDNAVVSESEIYRWGTLARNGQRMYDVALVS